MSFLRCSVLKGVLPQWQSCLSHDNSSCIRKHHIATRKLSFDATVPRMRSKKYKYDYVGFIKREFSKNSKKSNKCGNGGKRENLAAVLRKAGDLQLEKRPMPKIGDEDVLLAMDCVGICGTDVHFYSDGKVGTFVVQKPMVTGHESSGIVAEVGKKVKSLKVGDRVAVEPGLPCRKCAWCKAGRYNLCPGMRFCSLPPTDGALQRYFKHAPDFCHKLPDHMTMEEGALMEPLSIGTAACRRAGIRLGSEVLILGSGPIGLVSIMVAQASGASKIAITDVSAERLEFAEKLGAKTIKICDGSTPEHLAKEVWDTLCSKPDKTIDCSGADGTVKLGILATRSGGSVTMCGFPVEKPLPLGEALIREVALGGIFLYCNDYPVALALAASGKLKHLKEMVTHHFDMEKTVDAFNTSKEGKKAGVIKVMIHVQPRDTNNKEPFDSCSKACKE